MSTDGIGGAFVIWNDLSVSTLGHTYGTHLTIEQSDIISPGVGVPLISNNSQHSGVSIEKAALGSAIMVWADDRNVDNSGIDIYTQRVDTNCNTLWSLPEEGGIPLCDSSGNQEYSKVTYYDENYTIAVWEDHRSSPEFGDIYYQFLDANGNEILDNQGVPICTDSANQIKPRVKASSLGAFIIWEDYRNDDADIYSQKVDHLGNTYWQNDGLEIVVEVGVQDNCRLSVDGDGGVFYVWLDERSAPYPETDVYMQHIDSNNNISFQSNGLALCNESYYQFAPIVRGTNGEAIVLWGDRRTGSIGLYLQHIYIYVLYKHSIMIII